jgi:RNA polymerase sigma-70 factor (ECF subfamily)
LPELVESAKKGNRAAFGELYARFAGLVYSIAAAGVRTDEAADVVQEAFLRALRKLKGLRDPSAFRSWIAAIARNATHDHRAHMSTLAELEHEPVRPETQHHELEAGTALSAIRGLPVAYRDTVRMRLLEGLTGPEIARRTGLTVGSVRVNLHRGIRLLREQLQRSVRSGSRRPHSTFAG